MPLSFHQKVFARLVFLHLWPWKQSSSAWPAFRSLSHTAEARGAEDSKWETRCLSWATLWSKFPPQICHCFNTFKYGIFKKKIFKGDMDFKNTEEHCFTRVHVLVWECEYVHKIFFKNSTSFYILPDFPNPLILIILKRTGMLLASHDTVDFLVILLFLSLV